MNIYFLSHDIQCVLYLVLLYCSIFSYLILLYMYFFYIVLYLVLLYCSIFSSIILFYI